MALVSVGACANINPPRVGVEAEQMRQWGEQVAEAVRPALLAARSPSARPGQARFSVATAALTLPLESWSAAEVENHAEACLADPAGYREFGDKYLLAINTWRSTMMEHLHQGRPPSAQAELSVVALGESVLLGVNAELFSRFTALVNAAVGGPVYTLTCTNGMIGYVPSAEAYDEGGYEVSWSMLFYDMSRPKKGGLELLVERAGRLIAGLPGNPHPNSSCSLEH